MVELDESRRYATNYFRALSDFAAAKKALSKVDKKRLLLKPDDKIDYAKQLIVFEDEVRKLIEIYNGKLIPQISKELDNGFSVLMYGFGSKSDILDALQRTCNNYLFINGYDQQLAMNSVYSSFLSAGINLRQQVLTSPLSRSPLVIIYGLDSVKLRSESFYKSLASARHRLELKLVVTVEDPHYSLLFTPGMLDQFNFIHHDCTSFLPYGEDELESLPDLVASRTSNRRSIKGALFVLQSLTANARSIFKVLAEHQLASTRQHNALKGSKEDSEEEDEEEEEEEFTSNGISQLELFKIAQGKFLISSEPAFKTLLTEFLDHELVKVSQSCTNNEEVLRIPFSPGNIRDILSMMLSMN